MTFFTITRRERILPQMRSIAQSTTRHPVQRTGAHLRTLLIGALLATGGGAAHAAGGTAVPPLPGGGGIPPFWVAPPPIGLVKVTSDPGQLKGFTAVGGDLH